MIRGPSVTCSVALMLLGCGGHYQRSPSEGTGTAGVASIGGAEMQPHPGGAGGGAGAIPGGSGGSPAGGSGDAMPSGPSTRPIDDDDNPLQPPPSSPGAVFWGAGFIGNWFLTTDVVRDLPRAAVEPPHDGSHWARRATGSGLPNGAVMWLELNHGRGGGAVDLSSYSAIRFSARETNGSAPVLVALNRGARALNSTAVPPGVSTATLNLDADWKSIELPFEAFGLVQPVAIASIDFYVGEHGAGFDLWIDDLSFVCTGPCK